MKIKIFILCFILLLLLCGCSNASDCETIYSADVLHCDDVGIYSSNINMIQIVELKGIFDNIHLTNDYYQIIFNKSKSKRVNKTNRNKYFKENEKYHMDEIKSAVKEMLKDDINPQAHDFVSLFNSERFHEINHEILEILGEFDALLTTRGLTHHGKHRYMDMLELINPDGNEITKPTLANIEYIISKISDETIFDYDLAAILKFKKRPIYIHVVNKDPGVPEIIKIISGCPIRILYRVFDKKRQREVLNRLKNKIKNNEEITALDYMEFAHCIANTVKPDAKNTLKNVLIFLQQ